MFSSKKLDEVLRDLGHTERVAGTDLIRLGVALYDRSLSLTKELYPAIGKAAGYSPSQVERNIRSAIEGAWRRSDYQVQDRYFGSSVSPNTGRPTTGEYLAMLRRWAEDEN